MSLDQIEILGFHEKGVWVWCVHCERCYQAGEYRLVVEDGQEYAMCPYPECDGAPIWDSFDWLDYSQQRGKGWPVVPQRGVRYA